MQPTSALEMYTKSSRRGDNVSILTFIRSLDQHLKGGIPCGRGIVEIAGTPGSGKSQFIHQLMCMAQLPCEFGGINRASVIIDTESSFCPIRSVQMAAALQKHLDRKSATSQDADKKKQLSQAFTPNRVLDNIHVLRVYDSAELLAAVMALEPFFKTVDAKVNQDPMKYSKVGLVVIDSIAFPFRNASDFVGRSTMLNKITQQLNALAYARNLGTVVTNHMTFRKDHGLSPCLGDVWGHLPTIRFEFHLARDLPSNDENINPGETSCLPSRSRAYQIVLKKCAWLPQAIFYFNISEEGVREAPMI